MNNYKQLPFLKKMATSFYTELKSSFTNLIFQVTPSQTPSYKNKLPSLNGVRGLAIILVFLDHASGQSLNIVPGLQFAGTGLGKHGVYLFFVLSSFLITRQLLRSGVSFNKVETWLDYARKRVLRIYPLYLVVLLVYLAFPAFKYGWKDFVSHLFLVEGLNQFWAIPVEMKYYLFIPFIAVIFRVAKRSLITATIFIALLIGLNYLLIPTGLLDYRLSIFKYLSIFLIGSWSALLNYRMEQIKIRNKVAQYLFEILAAVSFVFMILNLKFEVFQSIQSSLLDPFVSSEYFSYVMYGFVWSVFLVSHLHGCGWIKSLLSHPIIGYIGMVSFSIYLWHMVFIGSLNPRLDWPESPKLVVIFLLTLCFSTLTYLLIESPFMRLKLTSARSRKAADI